MNSPAYTQFDFIILDYNSETPLYIQLVNEFIKAIQLGQLKNGTKLPGTRKLTDIFKLNRNTIVKSFEELAAQGWIEIKPNKGTFIFDQSYQKNPKINARTDINILNKASFDFEKSILLELPSENNTCLYRLNDGVPEFQLTELKLTGKYYSSVLKRKNSSQKIVSNEINFFLKQITNYLNITRNLAIDSSNLLITRNKEIALQIITKTLVKADDYIAVNELSHYKSNMIFQENKAKIIPIEGDKYGLKTDALRSICQTKKIRALYISPNCNYPTTIALSNQRKLEIKQLAKEFGFVIIETDQDFDIYYSNRPTMPLFTNNYDGNIIYTCAFGDELPPGFRLNFVIGPTDFISECKKQKVIYESLDDPLMMQTIGEMIAEGELFKTLKKHRKIYREKRDYFCNILIQSFGNEIKIQIPKNGLAVWIEWQIPINLFQLKKDAEKLNLFLPQSILYQTRDKIGMRIGFANWNEEEMHHIVKIIQQCIYTQILKS